MYHQQKKEEINVLISNLFNAECSFWSNILLELGCGKNKNALSLVDKKNPRTGSRNKEDLREWKNLDNSSRQGYDQQGLSANLQRNDDPKIQSVYLTVESSDWVNFSSCPRGDCQQTNFRYLLYCHPDTEIFSKRRKIYSSCVDGRDDAWKSLLQQLYYSISSSDWVYQLPNIMA